MIRMLVRDENAAQILRQQARAGQRPADAPGGYAGVDQNGGAAALHQTAVAGGAAGKYDQFHIKP